ncbi:acyl-CoA N-acyltransferase [Lentinula edodes]|nr:acyl-CoA N-acyltransferase [Lentinula edodes]
MPSTHEISISSYTHARQLPDFVFSTLEANRIDANVILPLLRKSSDSERSNLPISFNQLWLCCISYDSNITGTVDMVLSCTENELGKYPIFIVPTWPRSLWTRNSLEVRLRKLAEALFKSVPRERVYSVFAPDIIVSLFSQQWSELAGVSINNEPYYAARLLSCTAVIPQPSTLPPFGTCRLADTADTKTVAKLCRRFSEESEPFVLEREGAFKEARLLISKEQVWVHCVSGKITCIAAFTRNTADTATITKVYTHRSWRRQGCAKRLVREVTEHLLGTGRSEVVLYVAHNNGSAAKVYESVGFVEPDGAVAIGHSVKWTEVGFDRNFVELGHW